METPGASQRERRWLAGDAPGVPLTGRTVVCGTARPLALVPPDVLGHLMHRFQLQRPKELRMMMGEVSLSRGE